MINVAAAKMGPFQRAEERDVVVQLMAGV